MFMRRDRRDRIRRERIIMLASSAFVLTALTATGLYMKGQEAKERNDGYTLDFSALESQREGNPQNKTENKLAEIGNAQANNYAQKPGTSDKAETGLDSDLDYMPAEELTTQAGSHLIQIPGVLEDPQEEILNGEDPLTREHDDRAQGGAQDEENSEDGQDTRGDEKHPSKELHYDPQKGLTRPVSGEVMLPYSMDGSIYFETLDQYKYNPATLFAAEEGSEVVACAEGKVVNIFRDAELGQAVTLDLGDGYQVTYGQLTDLAVTGDTYVNAGEKIGSVAGPSKYYVKEGSNLYFRLEKDGSPINAEDLF